MVATIGCCNIIIDPSGTCCITGMYTCQSSVGDSITCLQLTRSNVVNCSLENTDGTIPDCYSKVIRSVFLSDRVLREERMIFNHLSLRKVDRTDLGHKLEAIKTVSSLLIMCLYEEK